MQTHTHTIATTDRCSQHMYTHKTNNAKIGYTQQTTQNAAQKENKKEGGRERAYMYVKQRQKDRAS